jgi:hypothetical protein
MNHPSSETAPKVALLWRGDPQRIEQPTPTNDRLYPLFRALADLRIVAEPVLYGDEAVHQI